MLWNGKELETYGDVADAMGEIIAMTDEVSGRRKQRAAEFMRAYRADSEHADANVGYLCGYYGHDQMVEALNLFGVSHPILGDAPAAYLVTPERAFEMGKEWASR
jgi:hypothetical protein